MASQFPDLSGVVSSLVKELDGKLLKSTDLINHLPKFVLVAWTSNLDADKAQAQILAASKHLITKFVPAAEQAVLNSFVDATFPAILAALKSLIDQVKAEVLKTAAGAVADVEKVCMKSCLPSLFGFLNKCAKAVPAVAPAVVAVEAAVPVAVEQIPAVVESVESAAAADISAALSAAAEDKTEEEKE
jgi:hypothetical protein